MKTLILQSCSPSAPVWVFECCHNTEAWAETRGFDYKLMHDELFGLLPIFALGYSRPTQSDLCRLQWIGRFLRSSYDVVYWIDADFLIWNRAKFTLPTPIPGSVVCARESWFFETGGARSGVNNSICGLCCADDAERLAEITEEVLHRNIGRASWHTMAGTDIFTARDFPLRRIYVKSAGCFSEESISRIMGPLISGREHLRLLSRANGATLYGANLAASRGTDPKIMERLIFNLIQFPHFEAGRLAHVSGLVRAWLTAKHFVVRARRGLMRRARVLRMASSGKA